MRTDLPTNIRDTAHDLTADALCQLFQVTLTNNTVLLLSPTKEYRWQGDLYEAVPCHMTSVGQNGDGTMIRPKFSITNPGGIFSAYVYNGLLDGATVTRIRILKADLEADLDFALRETFRVSRIMNVDKNMIVLELRDVLDVHNFKLPARTFVPPEFPHVKLG